MERSLQLLSLLLDYTNRQVQLPVPSSTGPLGLPGGEPPSPLASGIPMQEAEIRGLDQYRNIFVYFTNQLCEKVCICIKR